MSLLARYLTDANRAVMSKRATPGGVRLEDVIRSGLHHPESSVGIYAPDGQSYEVFRELFAPILENFRARRLAGRHDLACLNPAAVVSTRIRIARNLSGHAFPAGMSSPERQRVEEKLVHACRSLASRFEGTVTRLKDMPRDRLDAMITKRLAFGSEDKYMAAAGIQADWPAGRSVFNTRDGRVSVWINEEDHLRVAVVMPGACLAACHELMCSVMSGLAARLDFCSDVKLGYLTSCPSNAGSGMRASYMVDRCLDASQEALLVRLESEGIVEIRGTDGEHSSRKDGLADIGFRNRAGTTELEMIGDMDRLLMTAARK